MKPSKLKQTSQAAFAASSFSSWFSLSKHKANTTELTPKVKQTCIILNSNAVQFRDGRGEQLAGLDEYRGHLRLHHRPGLLPRGQEEEPGQLHLPLHIHW